MKKHTLALLGDNGGKLCVPAKVLQETIASLIEGARRATRFFVEGESSRKGRRPARLDAACNMTITRLSAGSAVLAIEVPTIEEAAPERFGDGQL